MYGSVVARCCLRLPYIVRSRRGGYSILLCALEPDSVPAAQMFAHDDLGIVSAEKIASNWRKAVRSSSDLDNVPTASVAMGVNDPAPAILCNGAAIAPRPTGSTELVSDDLPVFHWRPDARIS